MYLWASAAGKCSVFSHCSEPTAQKNCLKTQWKNRLLLTRGKENLPQQCHVRNCVFVGKVRPGKGQREGNDWEQTKRNKRPAEINVRRADKKVRRQIKKVRRQAKVSTTSHFQKKLEKKINITGGGVFPLFYGR